MPSKKSFSSDAFITILAVAISILFLGIGIFSRVYLLGSIPVAPYWDEVAILADARMLTQTGFDLHEKPWNQALFLSYGDYKLPVLIWSTALVSNITQISVLAVRIPSVIAGLLSIVSVGVSAWLLVLLFLDSAKLRFAKIVGISSAVVMSLSPVSVFFSRVGFEAHLSQAIAGWSFCILLLAFYITQNFWARSTGTLLATLFASLATYTYFSTRFVIPVVLLFCLLFLVVQQKKSVRVRILEFSVYSTLLIATFFATLIPLFRSPLYPASNQFRLSTASVLQIDQFVLESNVDRGVAGNTLLDRVMFHRKVLQAQVLLHHFALHLSPEYLFLSGDSNLRHGTGQHGLFLISTLPFLLLGWLWLLDRKIKIAILLAIWWVLGILPAAIPYEVPHALRSLNAIQPIVLSMGFGLAVVYDWLQTQSYRQLALVVLLCYSLSIVVEFGRFIQYYTTVYPVRSAQSWQHGYGSVAKLITDWAPTHSVIVSIPDTRLLLWLFAFSDLDPVSIQQAIKTQGSLPNTVNAISFRDFKISDFSHPVTSTLLVGTADRVESMLQLPITQTPDAIIRQNIEFTNEQYIGIVYGK